MNFYKKISFVSLLCSLCATIQTDSPETWIKYPLRYNSETQQFEKIIPQQSSESPTTSRSTNQQLKNEFPKAKPKTKIAPKNNPSIIKSLNRPVSEKIELDSKLQKLAPYIISNKVSTTEEMQPILELQELAPALSENIKNDLRILELDLDKIPTKDETNRAFRKKALMTHPDKTNSNGEEFQQISNAREELLNYIDNIIMMTPNSDNQNTALLIEDRPEQELSIQDAFKTLGFDPSIQASKSNLHRHNYSLYSQKRQRLLDDNYKQNPSNKSFVVKMQLKLFDAYEKIKDFIDKKL